MTSHELLMKQVGGYGTFQKRIAFILVSSSFVSGMYLMSSVFMLFTPKYVCETSPKRGLFNSTNESASVPTSTPTSNFTNINSNFTQLEARNDSTDNCFHYVHNDAGYNMMPCDEGWIYNLERGVATATTEFDLICDNAWKRPLVQSLQMAGYMAGSLTGGILSDRYGRRTVLLSSKATFGLSCIAIGLVPAFQLVCLLDFVAGMGAIVSFSTPVVMLHEFIPHKQVQKLGIFQMVSCTLGYVSLPLLAYLLPNWRHMMMALGSIILVSFIPAFFVPETLRWLIENGRRDGAISLLQTIAKTNKVKWTIEMETLVTNVELREDGIKINVEGEEQSTKRKRKYSYVDMVKVSFLRRRLMILGFAWFGVNVCYFGFGFNTNNLGVSRYVSAFLAAVMEMPGDVICYNVVKRIGHRLAFTAMSFAAGVLLLGVPLLQSVNTWAGVVSAMIAKLFISALYSLLYVFTGNLFPTLLRHQAYGACSCVARVGSIIVPFFLLLGETVYAPIPYFFMSAVSIATAIGMYFIPETKGQPLPDTMEEAKLQEKNRTSVRCYDTR